jgi:hypothetical protein
MQARVHTVMTKAMDTGVRVNPLLAQMHGIEVPARVEAALSPAAAPAAVPATAEAARLAEEEQARAKAAETFSPPVATKVGEKRKLDIRRGKIEHIEGDGQCMFSALCLFLDEYDTPESLRKNLIAFMKRNKRLIIHGRSIAKWISEETGESFKGYRKRMAKCTEWGGQIELAVLPFMVKGLKITVWVATGSDKATFERQHTFKSDQPSTRKAHLLYDGECHYDGLLQTSLKHDAEQGQQSVMRYGSDGCFTLTSHASLPSVAGYKSPSMPTPVTIELGDCPRKSRKGVKKAKHSAAMAKSEEVKRQKIHEKVQIKR